MFLSLAASDIYYVCSTNGFTGASFSTIEKAEASICDFIVSLSRVADVPRQLYDELFDLLVGLKTRNLRWTSLKFQQLTLPKSTSNGEIIALQNQLSMCPELRPTNQNRQTTFGNNNWRPRNNNNYNNYQASSSSHKNYHQQAQNFRPRPPNPNFQN